MKGDVALITSAYGIINVGLDIHTKANKKLQENKKRKRNNRKHK
ncbi:hypothetical protein QNH49_10990 [Bacillus bombysepticus]|nr:hypothetical protein QNH49_10990 [Bacillus bombysepticus]